MAALALLDPDYKRRLLLAPRGSAKTTFVRAESRPDLIVAPPLEVSNQYLPVLGKIAQFAKEPDIPERLAMLASPQEFLKLLQDKNI